MYWLLPFIVHTHHLSLKGKLAMIDSIIFDLDGTIWDTTEDAANIWTDIAKRYPEVTDEITAPKLKSLYGLPLTDIAIKLFTSVPAERSIEIMRVCVKEQCPYLTEHGGILIGNIEETLKKLSKQYRLFIVSNCEDGYIQSFLAGHNFNRYFTDFACPGTTGLLKGDNIRLMMERHHLQNPVYVGDTYGDQTAAAEAGVLFAYAAYGFGEATKYDYRLSSFEELGTLFLPASEGTL